ncbi:hypothetical protein K503DRAFT_723071 [Rhizopogon vinicolor AM-OR11-026]|uniref:Uncharacterized protein n=1 Tax=Rhizopogon vinicolor AM-OR11-026 TaxID=1314800 RepID=A0A1B7MS27_9AGAM|nr:hypothetical protein K503DRAFT_723071 [Rhizopogon vinicolor AM-OR11-026]
MFEMPENDAACQKIDWKVHKRSVCTKLAMLHKLDKLVKKISGPGTAMGSMHAMEKMAWEERRRNPVPVSVCDGCFRRFRGTPVEPGMEEDDQGDAGDPFKRCTECDYTICEDCTLPEMQGVPYFDRPVGTCRCAESNFGISYCLSAPCYVDGDGRKPYHGDRHPDVASSGYDEDAYEPKERQCKTCGVVARCLMKEHLKDAMPGMK